MDLESLIEPTIKIAHQAGAELLKYYKTDIETINKADGSIVTAADFASDKIIRQELAKLTPDIPIVTEETIENFKDVDLSNKTYWCVDPLDGTKIFSDRKDEFSVLIALIQNGKPVLGINHAPALNETYYGFLENGAFINNKNGAKKLTIKNPKETNLTALIYDVGDIENTDKLIDLFPIKSIVTKTTALRDTSIAKQIFDVFCYAKTNAGEWDTAANQIILEEAGGFMCDKRGKRILYGDPYKNKSSIVSLSNPDLVKHLK